MQHSESDKARHYLDLLDTTRCNGQWQEIPELTRKVGKHAPNRQCLIHAAQTERVVADQSSHRPATTSSSTGLSQSIPTLITAIEQEKTLKEDAFQAQICLAWLYQTIGEAKDALSSLPTGLEQASERLARDGGITARWTHVCIIKGAYIRGYSLEIEGNTKDALQLYESMIPYISNLPSTFANTPEYQSWVEKFLSRYCSLSSRRLTAHIKDPHTPLSPTAKMLLGSALASFRVYTKTLDAKKTPHGGKPSSSLSVWRAYYNTITTFLKNDLVQPMFQSKLQLFEELKSAESAYEAILLKEVSFPRADQASTTIETWVDQVIANWRVICRFTWRKEDFGEADRVAVSRGVLDILYRAATRTFHSTRVLGHLFTVHAALAEFYLASKAIDSYLEILVKGKARAEKSGEDEIGLDDDSTAISTAAAGIKMLCYYGRRHEVEQSLKITKVVEDWLQKLHNPKLSPKPAVSANDLPEDLMEQPRAIKSPVHGKALALGYHALAIGQSYWARTTYETSLRSELQSKALANFRKALEPELGEEDNVEILYSFAFVLAETREIDPAIAIIKRALSPGTKAPSMNGVATADFASDNADYEPPTDADSRGLLLRSWHLLALLLSVRHEFATAIASCEAALDLYGNKSILYGNTRRLDTSGLALSERKNIIEIKVTQLALSEVVDGPEEAVNSSGELLGLYAELFKHVQKPAFKIQVPFQSPPSSANGTLRSLRGSILGLPKDPTLKSRNTGLRAQDTTSGSLPSFETPEEDTRPPTISVTGLDGATSRNTNHHSHFLGRHESNKLRKRNSRKSMVSRRTSRAPSPSKPSSSEEPHRPHSNLHLPFRNRHDEQSTTDGSGNTLYMDSNQYASDEVGVAISHDLPSIPSTPAAASDPQNPLHATPSTTQNMNHRNPNTHPVPPNPPSQQPTNPPTTPSLSPLLEPHYPPAEESRHALALLTKIWLVISSLYRRASMPADAQGALSEATTHVQSIELDIANREGSSAENFSTPGFGGLKACGELWADVLADQATLHVQLGDINAASEAFEKALVHWPDHVAATIGLCNILLDEYSAPHPPPSSPPSTTAIPPSTPTLATLPILPSASPPKATKPTDQQDLLSRLAARDRAYGLLSALTKSGAGWDCGEAWMAFARAEEESGMLGRAEEALWWVVGLEGGRAVRGLGCLIG